MMIAGNAHMHILKQTKPQLETKITKPLHWSPQKPILKVVEDVWGYFRCKLWGHIKQYPRTSKLNTVNYGFLNSSPQKLDQKFKSV